MNSDHVSDAGPVTDVSSRVERFFVGDRDVGAVVGGASLAATQMSAGTFVGTIGIHYTVGVSFVAIWPGIWLGWLFSMAYVAPQFRRFGGVTVPDFVAERYAADGADGRRSRALVATVIAAVYLVYTAAQYIAGGIIVEQILGVPRLPAMVGIVVLVLAYTAAGGMRASIVTDAVQMSLMLAGLLVAVAVGVADVGGIGALHARVVATDPSLLGWGMSPVDIGGFALAFGLGMAVAPYEISRVYAMEDADTVRRAIPWSVAIQAVVAVAVAVLGLVARVSFPALETPDAAVARLIQSLFGPVAGTLLLLAVLAAVVSTVDSVLLVSSSALAYDLYGAVLRPEGGLSVLGDDDVMQVARAVTGVAAVVPLLFAVRPELLGGLVQLIVALYAALVAGSLFAPVVLGLHARFTTTAGGLTGVVVGVLGVAGWHVATVVIGAVPSPYAVVPPVLVGVLASAAATVGVSLADGGGSDPARP